MILKCQSIIIIILLNETHDAQHRIFAHVIFYLREELTMNAPFSLFNRPTESTQALPMLHSNNLFALGREIRILHAGEEYRLRLTRNNRLILTK